MMNLNQMKKILQYPDRVGYKKTRTSKQASLDMQEKAPTIRQRCLSIIKNKQKYGATPDEVAQLLSLEITTVRPRFSELVKKGCIRDSRLTRKNRSGKQAIVWEFFRDE